MRKSTPSYHQKKIFPVKQPPQDRKPHFQRGDKVKNEESSEVVCYVCGTPGVIKPKCPCKGKDKRNHGTFSSVILQSASCPSKHLATLEVTINGVMGTACADTAATHSIAGETLYHILKKQGTTFSTGSLTVSLIDGSKIEREVNTVCEDSSWRSYIASKSCCHSWSEKQQHPFGYGFSKIIWRCS
ncbi:retrovirus-related Pol polyprotein from transposon 17.6 [Nephila pilipes]|uniref:Retrovirus-related Pol polyprotein from transposon 17.6 n=1 Tax=Nephila pilipes TaxID=299642 RepID=A0A8X6P066_NEPPI|nr:retrovirus-related Pol polyprotein from transposon 17.6 [Nephila pilipes]